MLNFDDLLYGFWRQKSTEKDPIPKEDSKKNFEMTLSNRIVNVKLCDAHLNCFWSWGGGIEDYLVCPRGGQSCFHYGKVSSISGGLPTKRHELRRQKPRKEKLKCSHVHISNGELLENELLLFSLWEPRKLIHHRQGFQRMAATVQCRRDSSSHTFALGTSSSFSLRPPQM